MCIKHRLVSRSTVSCGNNHDQTRPSRQCACSLVQSPHRTATAIDRKLQMTEQIQLILDLDGQLELLLVDGAVVNNYCAQRFARIDLSYAFIIFIIYNEHYSQLTGHESRIDNVWLNSVDDAAE